MKPIILDDTTKKLRMIMSGAAATTNPSYVVSYADVAGTFIEGNLNGVLNGTTPVDIVPAPASSTRRTVTEIIVKNNDTAPVTIYFQLDQDGITRPVKTITLAPDATWEMSTQTAIDGAPGTDGSLPIDYISGLKLEWLATNSLQIGTGTAILPNRAIVQVSSVITLSSMALTASTWYHLYLTPNATIEYSTTEPASPYFGVARTKSGDVTRRYLGSFRTDGSGNIYKFLHLSQSGTISYNVQLPLILVGGTATTQTAISIAVAAPTTTKAVQIAVIAGGSGVLIVNSANETIYFVPANSRIIIPFVPVNGNYIYYRNEISGGNTYIALYGYSFER